MEVFTRIQKSTKPQSTVAAFAVSGIAPMFISRALSRLTITHLTCGYDSSIFKYRTTRTKAPCVEPPALPVICVGLDSIRKFKSKYHRHVLFVCDSNEQLKHTNLKPLPGKETDALIERVKSGLLAPWDSGLEITVDEPSLLEYVDKASKPSLLRDIQTLVYKINPYALRKDIQFVVMLYLSGKISRKAAFTEIALCSRSRELQELLQSPASQILIKALKKAQDLPTQQVADEFGIDVFDLNFVRASVDKQHL